VIPGTELDPNTPQTPGMDRKAAVTFARVGAQKLWAGTVHIHPNAKTGAHHHGPLESVIFVLKGRARMRWGERLEFVAGLRAVPTFRQRVGRARTVRGRDDFLTVIRALHESEPGEVLVIDGGGGTRALAGELFATEAARRGLAGIVIDGACR